MTIVHWEPDIAVTPCLGCDERIAPIDLVKAERSLTTTMSWHPYHFWCIRDGTPPGRFDRCAECTEALVRDDMVAMLRWAGGFTRRLHRRLVSNRVPPIDRPDLASRPPPGFRCVSIGANLYVDVPDADGLDRDLARFAVGHFEVVHDVCGADPDGWRARLRDAPGDRELRAVYADWLEQRGELDRAAFVRLAIQRHSCDVGAELRDRRATLSGTWCRDVCV